MSLQALAICIVLCALGSCWGEEEAKRDELTRQEDRPSEPLGASTDADLSKDVAFWRFWKFWKWGRSMLQKVISRSSDMAKSVSTGRHRIHEDLPRGKIKNKKIMFYLDPQRTITRRDSSLLHKKHSALSYPGHGIDVNCSGGGGSSVRVQSTTQLTNDSVASLIPPQWPWGSVRREIVTSLFESMLDSIVDSWEVIAQPKYDDISTNMEFGKAGSDVTIGGKKKDKKPSTRTSKTKKSRSKLDVSSDNAAPIDLLQQTWWSAPDEKAVIRFKNGNVYEGNISMKCMHGEGRFQWADGTVYLGHFVENVIKGQGELHWKDNTWYEGEFYCNVRHGRGLYVDSRGQRHYCGGWYLGSKHGEGVICYSNKNSYDGEWDHNVRHGYGLREYCSKSGYEGEWDRYLREGKGMMIWPNHDFYKGEWKNGVMSGYGIYVWDAYFNYTMSLPSINVYRGHWQRGTRNGHGVLNLGLGLGSHYKGEFKDNKKHGPGKFVTNNGLILRANKLFHDDILGPISCNESSSNLRDNLQPYEFDICDDFVGLTYHIEWALANIDKEEQKRLALIKEYYEHNKDFEGPMKFKEKSYKDVDYHDLRMFEETSLRKAISCYESDLKQIYHKYASICNTREVMFKPILIRLFLWQFYYDCDISQKGLTLIDIDKLYSENPDLLVADKHDPFEKVYFWQFLHLLISVASRLYAKKHLPGPKPDTILAEAFRFFMDNDVLPGTSVHKGRLQNFGLFTPLKGLYNLYRKLGEPHTVRRFLCACHQPTHWLHPPPPELVDAPEEHLPLGQNLYSFGDEMVYVTDAQLLQETEEEDEKDYEEKEVPLFNFGNLSTKTIIKIFAQIMPKIMESDYVMTLDLELTFYEFFEAFVACTEESIRVKEEELRWRQKFSLSLEHTNIHDTSRITNKSK